MLAVTDPSATQILCKQTLTSTTSLDHPATCSLLDVGVLSAFHSVLSIVGPQVKHLFKELERPMAGTVGV